MTEEKSNNDIQRQDGGGVASSGGIPQLAPPEQLVLDEIKPYLLDPADDYPEPRFLLEFNGVGFSPLGGIQAISGQKKNGKTFVLAQLMAAVLGTGTERVQEYLGGLQTRQDTVQFLGREPSVLYCDTEMEQLNTAKVLRRVHWLCGWDMKERNDRFHVLWLRSMPDGKNPQEYRWHLIRQAIEHFQPTMVVIDGVRDIVRDFNDNAESSQIVGEMMKIATENNCCIWSVLHANPRPSNDDEGKMRGHLGTELGNKVSDTFVSIKKKEAAGDVVFTVKQQDARGKDVDDWQFKVVDHAGGLGIPMIIGREGAMPTKTESDAVEDIVKWINEAKEKLTWPLSRKDVKKKVFGEIGGQKSDGRQQADLVVALNMKLLVESAVKVKGYYLLMYSEDLPF